MSVEGVTVVLVQLVVVVGGKSLLSLRIIVVLMGVAKVETVALMAVVVQRIQLHVSVLS